jgi:hypothetical protein
VNVLSTEFQPFAVAELRRKRSAPSSSLGSQVILSRWTAVVPTFEGVDDLCGPRDRCSPKRHSAIWLTMPYRSDSE